MTRKYTLTYLVDMDLEVEDSLVEEVLHDPTWAESFYDLDEEELAEMLGRLVGIDNLSIDQCDGFVGHDRDDVRASNVEIILDEYQRKA